MGPTQLPLNKPIDARGYLHKAFQLIGKGRATVYITLDPMVILQAGKSMPLRSGEGIAWTEIARLSEDKPYATHVGLGAGIMVSANDDVVVIVMGHT